MRAKVKRFKVMTSEKPNKELHKKGAVPFSEIERIMTTVDSPMETTAALGSRTPVKADIIGKKPITRKVKVDKLDPIGELVAKGIEHFPPEEEPVDLLRSSNLILTGITGSPGEPPITKVINSEKDLRAKAVV